MGRLTAAILRMHLPGLTLLSTICDTVKNPLMPKETCEMCCIPSWSVNKCIFSNLRGHTLLKYTHKTTVQLHHLLLTRNMRQTTVLHHWIMKMEAKYNFFCNNASLLECTSAMMYSMHRCWVVCRSAHTSLDSCEMVGQCELVSLLLLLVDRNFPPKTNRL